MRAASGGSSAERMTKLSQFTRTQGRGRRPPARITVAHPGHHAITRRLSFARSWPYSPGMMPSTARRLVLTLLTLPACGDAAQGDSGSEAGTTGSSSGAPTTAPTGGDDTDAVTGSGGTGTSTGAPDEGLASGKLLAGVALAHITGPVGASMAGFGGRTEVNETAWNDVLNGTSGFYGYGTAKAIALEVEGERLVLLKMPTMSSEASLTDGTIARLKEKHGIDLEGRLLTGATHSHHNIARYWRLPPALGAVGADSPDEEIIDRLCTQLADVVKAAIDDLGDAEWGTAWADDWDPENLVYRDRRGENNPTYGKDPRLTILAVRRPGGAPMAAILNFGMHGTVFDSDNELFTEDAAGGLEMKFEEHFFARTGQPIFGMFIQSGGGDASPAGDRFDHPGPARVELLGHDAAPRIFSVYEQIEWKDQLTLGVRSRRIDLTYDGIGYDEIPEFVNKNNYPYKWGAWQCKGVTPSDDANPATSSQGEPKDCDDIGTLVTTLGGTVPHAEMHQMYTTVAALDDFYLVSLPGEPTYSVIKHLREELGARGVDGMAFGYSQDHMLYLTHPDDWYQGGYEAEMSLWGPLAGQHIVARQMELVEALQAGEGTPVWSEETPNLSVVEPFEPRAFEVSEDAGEVLIDVPGDLERGSTIRLRWGGGDPSLGDPHVVLQRDEGDGEFTDVPAPSGWPGAVLDNSRYHMLTHYEPDPKPNGKVLPSRKHHWYVDFQADLELPAGDYRLVATGDAWDGKTVAPYTITSSPFLVTQSKSDELSATLAGDQLTLVWTHIQPALEMVETWPVAGYRLLDPEVGPGEPATLRAPLTVEFFVDGAPMGATFEVPYVAGTGHVLDFTRVGLPVDGLSVRAHLGADIVPAFVEAPVTGG